MPFELTEFTILPSPNFHHATLNVGVTSMKRKKSIELSKGESLSIYTREPGARWKSMEVYGLEILVASENSYMSLRV